MDSFELNKIIGALLGVVFVIFSISLISDSLFHSAAPEKPGYAIEAAEGAGSEAAPKKEEVEDIKPMLASADPEKGAAIFKRCHACHTDDQSGANKVGPNLWGVVDRPVASHEGFSYSAAMKEFSQGGKEHWTYDHLNHFLDNPKKFIPGTAMGFAGLPKAEDRANVIAYLRTQADTPAPLPEPEAASSEGGDKEGGANAAEQGGKAATDGKSESGASEGAAQQETGKAESGAEKAPAAENGEDKTPAAEGEQTAPASESSTTESGTSGAGGEAETDKAQQPESETPESETKEQTPAASDEQQRQDDGSTTGQ